MRALVLAAGYGSRLRPVTDSIPKCLVPIHGKPLLAYWLELLRMGGVERVLVNGHYLAHQIESFVSLPAWAGFVTYVYEDRLLGTGGTVLRNRDNFSDGQPFIVTHGDNLSKFDVSAFIRRHMERPPGVDITMMTFYTDVPQTCGIVEIDEAGVVTSLHEKDRNPQGNLANAAVYIFEQTVLNFLESMGKEYIDISTEVLPAYLGRIQTYHNDRYHRDIGTPESLAKAREEFIPDQK